MPGIDETLRVYGRAEIVPGEAFGDALAANGRAPATALKITVERAFFQCAKALMRARLWSADAKIDRASFPTLGEILKDQTGDAAPAEAHEDMLRRYAKEL